MNTVVGREEGTHPPGRLATRGLDVLVVEDDANARENFKQFLRSAGHRVVTCADGPDALQHCALRRFDVVVSDVRLPGLDGMDLLRRLRADAPDLDVILVTGYA